MLNMMSWNNTMTPYNNELCVHNKLENTAKLYPDKIAVISDTNQLTYSQLDKNANKLSHYLHESGINSEDFVVVYLNRSVELILSIFGILKAGGIYVPFTKDVPKNRLITMLTELKPKVIITNETLKNNISNLDSKILLVEDLYTTISPYPEIKINIVQNSKNLAYAIYTSGSTGNPKAVLIEHHSVINRIEWMQKQFPITSEDVLIQKTPITFDVSIWELFWWSFVGASLVIPAVDIESQPEKILKYINKFNVSIIHFVPSMFNTFIQYLDISSTIMMTNTLKWIFCSGEELYQSQVLSYYSLTENTSINTTIVNLYGPTEATVDVSYHICPRNQTSPVPIGKPIDNTQIYIIDEENNILSENKEGEIILCGVNLARHYYNNELLSAQKFTIIDVFGTPTRAYKTGDLGFYNSQGDIIYKGRKDTQIKLRGFRIELSEIENVILSFENIAACVCVVQNQFQENAHIIAVIKNNTLNEIDINALKQYLSLQLPHYMVPSRIISVEQIPLSMNGKADRKALLEKINNIKDEAPQKIESQIEKKITDIWCLLLKKSSISKNTNFFDLGGNSLLLVQMTLLLNKEFNIEIDIFTIMENPTINKLTNYFQNKSQ